MPSNINPYNIDGTFPIAGQDNSSQGFRNNFTNIKNNFAFAEAEISDLQSKVIVSSALNGQTVTNDMAGTQIRRPQLAAWTQSLIDLGTVDTTAILDFNQANFQKITTAGSINLSFINWPATVGVGAVGYGVMRIWIVVTSASHTVQLPYSADHTSGVVIGTDDIAGYIEGGLLTFDTAGNYIFDVSSIDGGVTFQIFDVSRNHSVFRDPSFYFNSTVSPALYIGFNAAGLTKAQSIESTADSINCHEGINMISAGDLWTANVHTPVMTFSELPGYHMYAARGNIDQGNIQAVSSNDPIGYITSRAFTGNTSSNVWQNMSSIQFNATGNVATRNSGLGGNISLWTATDATPGTYRLVQAVGIENDQSTKFYGNVTVNGYHKTASTLVEGGTYVTYIAPAGGTFTANASVSTVIIDSTGVNTQTINTATIILPSNPIDRQRIKIVSVAPITTANVWAPNSALVKYVPSNKFSGNVGIALTYMSSVSTWYLS